MCVVGCGSVGSALLHLICYKSLEYKLNIDNLYFIDPDLENCNNFCYPKVYLIEDQLIKINSKLNLRPLNCTFQKYYNSLHPDNIKQILFIDCRDSMEQSSVFYMKIFSDGPYGRIIKYPKDNIIIKYANYKIKNSKYYANLTVCRIIEDILNITLSDLLNKSNQKQIDFIINHLCPIDK